MISKITFLLLFVDLERLYSFATMCVLYNATILRNTRVMCEIGQLASARERERESKLY